MQLSGYIRLYLLPKMLPKMTSWPPRLVFKFHCPVSFMLPTISRYYHASEVEVASLPNSQADSFVLIQEHLRTHYTSRLLHHPFSFREIADYHVALHFR